MRESVIEKALVHLVEAHGGECIKFAPTSKGLPDRIVLMPGGRITFVELKSALRKPKPLQLSWQRRLLDLGFKSVVVDSIAGVKELELTGDCYGQEY